MPQTSAERPAERRVSSHTRSGRGRVHADAEIDEALEPEPEPALEPEPEPEDAVDESTREALVTTIRGYLPDLQACYEAELPRDSSLAGKMTYTITVEPAGKVSAVLVELDTVEDALVRQCAVAMIEGWTFVAADIEEPSEVTFVVRFAAV